MEELQAPDIDNSAPQQPLKCLVTGASGYIGSALAAELATENTELTLLSRREPARAASGRSLALDLAREPLPEDVLQGVDVVYHCAGIAHQAASAEAYEAVNFDATMALAGAASAAGVGCFVFLSSVQARPDTGPYGYWKWRAEEALREASSGWRMSVLVLRPALVYGAGARANLALLLRAARLPLPLPPAGGRRSLVALRDVCDCLRRLPRAGLSGYHCFQLTDTEPYTSRRLMEALRVALGRKPGVAWLPRPFWWLGCLVLDLLRGQAGKEGSYHKLFAEAWYEDSELYRVLDWKPRYRFEDLAVDMVKGD